MVDEWVHKGDKMQYLSVVYFTPHGSSAEHPALAGFIYDPDFMKNTFFPQALNEVVPSEGHNDSSHPATGDHGTGGEGPDTIAASACWDGGRPEVERTFEGVFPGMILGIGLHGTTIADMSRRFARQ